MEKLIYILMAILMAFETEAQDQWELVWSDEFEDTEALNSELWKYEIGPNPNNGELQYYTDKSTNCRVENGVLILEVLQESIEGKNYSSARLNSKMGWKYGKFEISARMTKGNALWPAIWLYPDQDIYGGWPKSGEIDIMENWSWDSYGVYGTIHTEAFNHVKQTEKQGRTDVSTISTEFHVYGIEWYEDQIIWSLDGIEYFKFHSQDTQQTYPFDHPFHFILNVAVESSAPGKESSWTKPTMEIDFVRVYQGVLQGPERIYNAIPGKIEAELFSDSQGVKNQNCSEGGQNVAYIDPNDYMAYDIDVAKDGYYEINFRIAAPSADNKFDIKVDDVLLKNVTIPKTGGWQSWKTFSETVYLKKGKQSIKLVSNGAYNLNWLEMVETTEPVTQVENRLLNQNLKIYPNPVRDYVNINLPENLQANVVIYNTSGSKIASFELKNSNNQMINLSGFESGVYYVIATDKDKQFVQKLIKI